MALTVETRGADGRRSFGPAGRPHPRAERAAFGAIAVIIGVLVVLMPWILPASQIGVAHQVLLAVPAAVALNLVMGVAGQVSLATAAMLAAGAFTSGIITMYASIGLIPSMLLSGIVGFVLGIVVGLPSVRIRGLYLLIATLALQSIVAYVTQRVQNALVGPAGFSLPVTDVFGWQIFAADEWYFALLVYACLVILGCVLLLRTNVGRGWRAVRDNELTATALGVNVRTAKLSAFAISSALIAMTGSVTAYYRSVVSYDSFTLNLAIQYVAMIIIGGMGSVAGATAGAILLSILPFILEAIVSAIAPGSTVVFNVELIVYGVAIILFLRFSRGGLAELGRRFLEFLRAKARTDQS